MYTIKRQSLFTDILKLEDENNNSKEIAFSLSLDTNVLKEYRKIQLSLIDLQKDRDDQSPEKLEKYGKCIVELFTLIFGEANTEEILTFYENNYTAMLIDIFPYIRDIVVPEFQKTAKRMSKNISNRFKK